jgi:hypothetical protein
MNLTKISCYGVSNEHGNQKRNTSLAIERGNTVLDWLKKYEKFKNVQVEQLEDIIGTEVSQEGKNDVNEITAKFARNAYVKL